MKEICWWVDQEYYPGPEDYSNCLWGDPDSNPMRDLMAAFAAAGRDFNKTIGSVFAPFGHMIRGAGGPPSNHSTGLALDVDSSRNPRFEPKIAGKVVLPPIKNHGPRTGNQFDHRGRRRW